MVRPSVLCFRYRWRRDTPATLCLELLAVHQLAVVEEGPPCVEGDLADAAGHVELVRDVRLEWPQ